MTWGKATDAQLLEVLNASCVSLGILPFLTPKSTGPHSSAKISIQCKFFKKQGLNGQTPRGFCEAQNKEIEKRDLLHSKSFDQKTQGIGQKTAQTVVCDPEWCQYYIRGGIVTQYSVRHYVDVKICKPLGWNLVGNGASYEACGHIWFDEGKGCLEVQDHPDRNIYVRLIAGTCFRFECPVCYKKTCARAAGRIAERFERIPKAPGSRGRSAEASAPGLGRPIHLVVSVPEEEAHLVDGQTLKVHGGKFNLKSNYSALRAKAYKLVKKAGFKGGCCIFHPFANDKMHEDNQEEAIWDMSQEGVDLEWLKGYFDKQDRHVGFWYKRPHFHFIGYAPRDWNNPENDPFTPEKIEAIHQGTGWVIVNLGVRDSVYMTALYQLSHAGVKKGVQVVTWMGCMSNSTYYKLRPESERPRDQGKCPECGAVLQPVRWEGEGDPPLQGQLEGGYWIDPGGWRYLEEGEKNHSCLVRRPTSAPSRGP